LEGLSAKNLSNYSSVTAEKKKYKLNAYQRPTISWDMRCETEETSRVDAFSVIYQYRSIGFQAKEFMDETMKFMLIPFALSFIVSLINLSLASSCEKRGAGLAIMLFFGIICFAASVMGVQRQVLAVLSFKDA
jgi:hypothetical protein